MNQSIGFSGSISIHALREEGDYLSDIPVHLLVYFYPRPPRGGRHLNAHPERSDLEISIHALREEGDEKRPTSVFTRLIFLSTPSARRATFAVPSRNVKIKVISIHALREEGDSLSA